MLRNCSERSFQFLDFVVLLEKLLEKHRVYLIVTNTVGFSLFVAHNEIGIHLFHVFSHQTKLLCAPRIDLLLVIKADWFKRIERFAGLLHWLNLVLKSLGGCTRAKFAG